MRVIMYDSQVPILLLVNVDAGVHRIRCIFRGR